MYKQKPTTQKNKTTLSQLKLTSNMSQSPPNSSSHIWLVSYMKANFFKRVRRFLLSNKSKQRSRTAMEVVEELDDQTHVEEDGSLVLQRSVKKLHFGRWEEKEMAATDIRRIAREDARARRLMGELGVIPALVGMVASDDPVAGRDRLVAVKALIELANGSFKNKELMLEAGILSKVPRNIDILEESTRIEFAELVLQLSSLANTMSPLNSLEILPFLAGVLGSSSTLQAKESCLGALYNLSAVLENTGTLVSNGVVPSLLRLVQVKELSEKALATLGNLVVTLMGKKAMENSSVVPESLIEVLTWEDKPKCQELSAYILMILAHQSSAQRKKMASSRIVPMLIELALLGTPLAQKRAMKLLEWFKEDGKSRMGPHSGPQTRRVSMGSPISDREGQEGRRMMKSLVKQSLHKNLEMITQRAKVAASEESSKFKTLVISTSSKSLPY